MFQKIQATIQKAQALIYENELNLCQYILELGIYINESLLMVEITLCTCIILFYLTR